MGAAILKMAADNGIDVGNAVHLVALAFPGAVAFGAGNALAEQHLYRPLGFALGGMTDAPGAPEVLDVKFPAWLSSLVSHSTQQFLWWKMLRETNGVGWVLDVANWNKHCVPVKVKCSRCGGSGKDESARKCSLCRGAGTTQDIKEKTAVGPYFFVYFSYVLHSCYKDILKTSGRKGGAQQILFDLHHLLTVALISSCVHFGTWRCGILTRIIHDMADIVLYTSKLRQALYETRGGHPSVMHPWFTALLGAWLSSRVVLYGYFVKQLKYVYDKIVEEKFAENRVPYALQMIGSFLMWVLQIAFFKGLVDATLKFSKSGRIDDPFHGTTALKKQ